MRQHKLNNILICLIPKARQPNTPVDFTFIPLCNVTLKIITKAMANCIKPILDGFINPYPSASILGKLITNNSIIAYEAFHTLNRSQSNKKCYVGIKLDMAKAYCRLELDFIDNTLNAMGFPRNMNKTIMDCVLRHSPLPPS